MDRTGRRLRHLPRLLLLLAPWTGAHAQHQMVLPLQYNGYHPASARSLALGNCQSENLGPSACFGNPAELGADGRWGAGASGCYLSGTRSHIGLESRGSAAFPSMVALAGGWRSVAIAAGYRQAQAAEMARPNLWRPYQRDRAQLELWQLGIGASVPLGNSLRLGSAVSRSAVRFQWQGPDGSPVYVDGSATGFGIDAGIQFTFAEDWDVLGTVSTKTDIRGSSDFLPDAGGGEIELFGAIPPRTKVALRYRAEPDFTVCAEAELTGWQATSWAYTSRVDYRAGAELLFLGGRAAARLGAFTLCSPLEEADRTLDPGLHDMYFISCGGGLSISYLQLDIAAASSRPLSGDGLNQNIVVASVNVHFR